MKWQWHENCVTKANYKFRIFILKLNLSDCFVKKQPKILIGSEELIQRLIITCKGAFNNYVEKMREGGGGQKMSVFVHAQGINVVYVRTVFLRF